MIRRLGLIILAIVLAILAGAIIGKSQPPSYPYSPLPPPMRYCEDVEPTTWNYRGVDQTSRGCANPINSNCEAGHSGSDAVFLGCEWGYTWSRDVSGMAEGVDWIPMQYGMLRDDQPCPYLDPNSGPYLLGPNEPLYDYATVAETAHRMWTCYSGTHPYQGTPAFVSFLAGYQLDNIREEYCRLYGEPPHWYEIDVHCYGVWHVYEEDCRDEIRILTEFGQAWGVPGGIRITESGGSFTGEQGWIETFWPLAIEHRGISGYAEFATRYRGDEAWVAGWPDNTSLIECEDGVEGPILTASGEFWMTYEPPQLEFKVWLPIVRRQR